MMNIAITGMGVVSPAGNDLDAFWQNLEQGRSLVRPIERFDASKYASRIAGEVIDLEVGGPRFSNRLLKKMDRFSHMALRAADSALSQGQVALSEFDLSRCGVFMGNAIGGWMFAETELRDLHVEGRDGVSPYMASAWFAAAPQGQISIYYGLRGYSKTIVADRASALNAIAFGAAVVESSKLDMVLAGGTEAPITPYALLCCNTSGSLSTRNEIPDKAYAPFDASRDGFALGEGSGMLVLERRSDAERRGVDCLAKICGFSTNCDGFDRIAPDPSGRYLAEAIETALDDAEFEKNSIDYICLDGAADEAGDLSETRAVKKVFGQRAFSIPISVPKSMFGNLLGAGGAVDIITTVLAMRYGKVPPTVNLVNPAPECDLNYVPDRPQTRDIRRALVVSRGRGGINSVMALERGN